MLFRVHLFEKAFCEILFAMCQGNPTASVQSIVGTQRTRRRPTGLTTTVRVDVVLADVVLADDKSRT